MDARQPRHRLGLEGLEYFKGLIGGPPSDWELEQASFTARDVEFSLVSGARRLELRVTPDPAGAVRLSARGGPCELGGDEGALTGIIGAGLARTGFVPLMARLSRDGLLYCDPKGGVAASRFERYYRVVDHSLDYWKFLYPQTRFLEQEVRFGGAYAQVSHATLECRLNNPLLSVGPLRFFAEGRRSRARTESSYIDTAISEADVAGGRTQEVLGRALERAASEKPLFIHLKTTCLPELIGDNPAPFIRRLEAEAGVPVLWTSKTREPGPGYEGMVERLLTQAAFAEKRDPDAVLLAGVATEAAGREASALLAGLGLRVVGALLPDLDLRKAPELGSASSVVWLDAVGWEKIADGAFLRHGLTVVRHHPPFGLAGTRAWLERAACVLGKDGAKQVYEDARQACDAALAGIAESCRRRTVALIGDRADIELLTSSGRAFGFSVAGLLCELGFDVRCLVWSARPAGALRRAKTPRGAWTIGFASFSTPAQLDSALGRGVDLAFTHFNRDPRLEAHGLLGFTEEAFEPGLEGLVRAGRALLLRCAARPFPKHRSCLRPWTP